MTGGFASRHFLLFLITGGIAAVVNWTSRIVYSQWMAITPAIVLAYLTGMVTAFVLARLFVFKQSQQAMHRSALFFTLVNAVAVLQTWAVTLLLARHVFPAMNFTWFSQEIAHAVGVVVPVFTSFAGHRRWSFR